MNKSHFSMFICGFCLSGAMYSGFNLWGFILLIFAILNGYMAYIDSL